MPRLSLRLRPGTSTGYCSKVNCNDEVATKLALSRPHREGRAPSRPHREGRAPSRPGKGKCFAQTFHPPCPSLARLCGALCLMRSICSPLVRDRRALLNCWRTNQWQVIAEPLTRGRRVGRALRASRGRPAPPFRLAGTARPTLGRDGARPSPARRDGSPHPCPPGGFNGACAWAQGLV